LVSELRLAKATTVEQANAVLATYRVDHNRRFAIAPQETDSAWRPVRASVDLEQICSFQYRATVLNDNTVRLANRVIDIPPGPSRRSYAHARVNLSQHLDGTWSVYFHGRLIARAAASSLEEVRPPKRRKRPAASQAFRLAVQRVASALP
jgi:hypothetical protein